MLAGGKLSWRDWLSFSLEEQEVFVEAAKEVRHHKLRELDMLLKDQLPELLALNSESSELRIKSLLGVMDAATQR